MPLGLRLALAAATALSALTGTALAAPGDLDPTFGGDGVVQAAPLDSSAVHAVAIGADGSVTAAGEADSYCRTRVAVARWLRDGSPDTAFAGGVALREFAGGGCYRGFPVDTARGLALSPDGNPIIAGRSADSTDLQGPHSEPTGLLAALTPTGARDLAFGAGAGSRQETEFDGGINDVVRLGDATLVAAGVGTQCCGLRWRVHRYTPDGTTINAAVFPGIRGGQPNAVVSGGSDGSVVVAGADETGLTVARVRPDGSLDPSFGNDGRTPTAPDGGSSEAFDVARTSDGGYVAAGAQIPPGGDPQWLLVKLTARGAIDATFGDGGRIAGPAGGATGIAVDAQGRLIVVGQVDEGRADGTPTVLRYTAAGRPDSTFGGDGAVVVDLSEAGRGGTITDVATDGRRIVVGGSARGERRTDIAVARLCGGGGTQSVALGDGVIGGTGGSPDATAGCTTSRVSVRLLSRRVTRRGVLVRVGWPAGTRGEATVTLRTRGGARLGQRTVAARSGTGVRFRVPLNRRAKRLLSGGRTLKIRIGLRVTGLPAPAR